jgi:hypothetical protein
MRHGNVALWLGNDQGTQEYWEERANDALRRAIPSYASQTEAEAATCRLADAMKDEIKDGEFAPDLGASMYSDLLNAALSEVNFYKIAEHYIVEAQSQLLSQGNYFHEA